MADLRVSYKRFLSTTLALAGIPLNDASSEDKEVLRLFVNLALDQVWHVEDLPWNEEDEQRTFTSGVLDLTALPSVEDVLAVYMDEPSEDPNRSRRRVEHKLEGKSVRIFDELDGDPWVHSTVPVPRYEGDAWDNSVSYAVGDVVFYEVLNTAGNITALEYYTALTANTNMQPDTSTSDWEVRDVPEQLERFLINKAAEFWMQGEGQHGKKFLVQPDAEGAWLDLLDRIERRQLQNNKTRITTPQPTCK